MFTMRPITRTILTDEDFALMFCRHDSVPLTLRSMLDGDRRDMALVGFLVEEAHERRTKKKKR